MAVEHSFDLRYTRNFEPKIAEKELSLLTAAVDGFCLKNKWLVLKKYETNDSNGEPLFYIWSFELDDKELKQAKLQDYTAYRLFTELLESCDVNVCLWTWPKALSVEYIGSEQRESEFGDRYFALYSAMCDVLAYYQYEPQAYIKHGDVSNEFTKRFLRLAEIMGRDEATDELAKLAKEEANKKQLELQLKATNKRIKKLKKSKKK